MDRYDEQAAQDASERDHDIMQDEHADDCYQAAMMGTLWGWLAGWSITVPLTVPEAVADDIPL